MSTRPVWKELSDPTPAAQRGFTSEYYQHVRSELLVLIRHEPRVVLDVGCAGAATSGAVKDRFPNAVVHGVELNKEVAQIAAARIDHVHVESVETLDFEAVGLGPGSLDLVFFPDVLEHLVNPWRVLERVRPLLAPDAQVLASIPNVRNLWLIDQLMNGNWDYVEEGLLDVTHIRFFTMNSIVELFERTGYRIMRAGTNPDARVPNLAVPAGQAVNIDTKGFTLRGVTQRDMDEFRTLQFLIDAVPA